MNWNIFKSKNKLKAGSLDELQAIGFLSPYHYDVLSETDKKSIAQLDSDFCVISHPEQTDRFVRCVLSIKINNSNDFLDYGIWISLSEKSFNDYKLTFNMDTYERRYFGMICNEIIDYEESTLNLHVDIITRNGGSRPEVLLHESHHELIYDWEEGINLDDAKERIGKVQTPPNTLQ